MRSIEHRSGPRCVLTAEADVDASRQVRRPKFVRITGVADLRALCLQCQQLVERERLQLALQRLFERRSLFTVQHHIIDEIGRSLGLVGGYPLDERFLAYRLQGVIQPPLLSYSRNRFLADGLPTERPGAVSRIDQTRVRQRQQLGFKESKSSAPRSVADQPSAARRSGRPT